MSKSSEQKIRLLVLYDILKSESDEERPLSTNELIEKLNEYGITATRQTIYDDIEMLNAFGYEILCNHGRNNRYFVGDKTSADFVACRRRLEVFVREKIGCSYG